MVGTDGSGGRIPAGVVVRLLAAEVVFLILTLIGVVLSISLRAPTASGGWALHLGSFWFSSTPTTLALGFALVLRGLAGVSAMNFLALTTPMIDQVELLRLWRMPELLIDLITIMYRFILCCLKHCVAS
ncbi:MAG: hypothetical protein HC802_19115 [Caldilineaceae bacterium]|nr:hypothetical protein [Caldilineaceae bacterium]